MTQAADQIVTAQEDSDNPDKQEPANALDSSLQGIQDMLQAGRLDDAENKLNTANASGDLEADVGCLKGELAERRHNWELAAELYEKVLENFPNHRPTMFRIAYLADRMGDDELAIDMYEQCTDEGASSVNAMLNLAVLYEDHGRYEDAAELVEDVLDAYPNHDRARLFYKDIESSLTMYYDEDQERVREQRNTILDTPVTDFELSVRSRNCLKQMNIHSLGDLLKVSEAELLAFKNFGETSLNEIKAMLQQKNLKLGQTADEALAALRGVTITPAAAPVPDGDPAVLNLPVSGLELSVRARKCLQRLGMTVLGDLAAMSEAELMSAKNFGQTSLNEVKRRLKEHGLSLRQSKD